MLEILTVIGILAVLAAMVLLGMRHVTGKSKEQETRLTLQNLRNMLAEYDTVTRLGKGPNEWGWNNGSRITVTANPPSPAFPPPLAPNFWSVPFYSNNEAPVPPGPAPAPLDAPGSAEGQDSTGRHGSRQLMFTQLGMNYLLSVPANRKAVEAMRADRLFTPKWVTGDLPAPGADGVLGADPDAVERVYYYVGCRVRHDNTNWRCKTAHEPGATFSAGSWDSEGQETSGPKSLPSPILLDGWNNPILLVPATGLRVRMLNGESRNVPTNRGQTFVIVSSDGSVKPPNLATNEPGKLVRPGKPFFVSAGPDGDYSTGDDNIYSFEE